jgi:hypothetical protein
MLVHVTDDELVDDLIAHYVRSGFVATGVGGGVVEILRPDAPDVGQEQREITLHLKLWEILNPGRGVRFVD